jgi:hypothetical protein
LALFFHTQFRQLNIINCNQQGDFMESNTESEATEAVAQPPALGLNDLSSILTIIEVCSTRGAFRAEELAVVGTLFNKIQAFVKSHEPRPADTPANTSEKDRA